MRAKLKNPVKLQCLDCKEIIFSEYEGQFSQCKCEDFIYIDQTKHYYRVGGDTRKITYLKEESFIDTARLAEMNTIISMQMNEYYPDVKFKLTSLTPVTLLHNSLELSLDNELLKRFINLVNIYCSEKEQMRIVVEYDILEEMGESNE